MRPRARSAMAPPARRRDWRRGDDRADAAARSRSRCFPARRPPARRQAPRPPPRRGDIWRSWMISVPTDSAASSRARCNGSAWSGNAASRPYMRLSQSSDRRRHGGDREAAQVAQGEGEQAPRPQCRRQRRQQAKRKRRDAAADERSPAQCCRIAPCRSSSGSSARGEA